MLYFNNEELDWIADDSSQDIESIFHKHPVIHIPERRLDYISSIIQKISYEHNGVDIKGLLRSVVKTLTGNKQGGSTIPMQVSKMLLTTDKQTLTRKIKDIYYAYEMSKTLTKNS
mgnify:FL=1